MIMTSILTYALIDVLFFTRNLSANRWSGALLAMMAYIPPYTLVPRFILSLRKLYARDLRGRRGTDIDTAFGLTSAPNHGAVTSAIMFADAGHNEGLEQSEEIQMEEREICGAGSGV